MKARGRCRRCPRLSRWNGENTRSRSASGMPGPASMTSRTKPSRSRRSSIRTGGAPCRCAFSRRLRISRRSSRASPCTMAGVPSRLQPSMRAHSSAATRQQVDLLDRLQGGVSAQPARQQDLVDQRVELDDVALDLVLVFRVAGLRIELDREPQPRQRRAQFVRGMREQQPVGIDQLLDARGGAVEGVRQPRDLVTAFDLDAGREIAGAERLDAGLQALEPARQPAHHRIGADRDRERNAAQQQQQPDERRAVARRRPHHEPAAVRQLHAPGRPLRASVASIRCCRRRGRGNAVPVDATSSRAASNSATSARSRVPRRSTAACCCRTCGAFAAGNSTATSSPAISNACAAGVFSAPSRQSAPATITTSTRLATMVR